MNSDTKRILRQFDTRDYAKPELYHQNAYAASSPPSSSSRTLGDGGFLVPATVLVVTVLYQAYARLTPHAPSALQLLWHAIVWLIPGWFLRTVDGWVNPPLFPLPPNPMLATGVVSTPARMTHAAKSEALRRILGLDKPGGGVAGGIMATVSQAGRRGLLNTLVSSKGSGDQPPGLGNLDNSCYQNSILQGLASLKPLPGFLAAVGVDGGEKGAGRTETRTTDTLRDLVAELNDTSNNGRTLWTPVVLKNMSTWQQQDAQEYFSKLLDEVDKEIAKATRTSQRPAGFIDSLAADICGGEKAGGSRDRDDSAASQHSDDSGYQSASTHSKACSELHPYSKPLKNPLEGLTAQRVACTSCGYSEGLSMIPFNCLTLNLGINKPEHDLYERLDSYTKIEPIQGVECSKCTLLKFRAMIQTITERNRAAGRRDDELPEAFIRLAAIETALQEDDFEDETLTKVCKIPNNKRVSSTKTKQTVIARPPQSLVIHVNRSVFDETTGQMFKNSAAVRFPMILDLGPWCLGSADGLTAEEQSVPESPVSDEAVLSAPNTEQWLLDPNASMVAGDLHPSKITGPIYELRAVVTHYGRHENGHYVCYRRHPRSIPIGSQNVASEKAPENPPRLAGEHQGHKDDTVESAGDEKTLIDEDEQNTRVDEGKGPGSPVDDSVTEEAQPLPQEIEHEHDQDEITLLQEEAPSQWWRLSDEDVTLVNEETVLAQGGVFMLFYDCVDPNTVLTADVETFLDTLEGYGEEAENAETETETETGTQAETVVCTPMDDVSDIEGEEAAQRAHPALDVEMTSEEDLAGSTGEEDIVAERQSEDDALAVAQSVPLPIVEDEELM